MATKTYIVIGEETYPVDTTEQIALAQASMQAADLEEADVYVGEPDGLGDSYKTGRKIFA
jgi:hypothetical protein